MDDAEATALQRQGELGLWASALGQEAAQVGSGRALAPNDFAFPTFREHENAVRLRERLSPRHKPVAIAPDGDMYRVLVGEELTEAAAQLLASQLKSERLYGKVVMLP